MWVNAYVSDNFGDYLSTEFATFSLPFLYILVFLD